MRVCVYGLSSVLEGSVGLRKPGESVLLETNLFTTNLLLLPLLEQTRFSKNDKGRPKTYCHATSASGPIWSRSGE